jgi:hypothetical protein
MQFLTFVFGATLLAPLVEFATSSSGHVEPRQGLALGWLGSVVAGLAVVFGTAERGQAGYCYGIDEGESGWAACTTSTPVICDETHNGVPLASYKYYYSHDSDKNSSNHCRNIDTACVCPP